LYVDVMRKHHEIMIACESNPGQAVELFYRLGQDVRDRIFKVLKTAKSKDEGFAVVEPTEVALLFIFAADPRVNQGRRHDIFQNMLVLNEKLKELLTQGDQAPAMRKLFVHWLFSESLDIYQLAGFESAAQFKVPELLPEALKVITANDAPAKRKA